MTRAKSETNAANGRLIHRRGFVSQAAGALLFLPALGMNFAACNRAAVADKVEDTPSWSTKIVSETEPGEPLIVSGRVYSPDGQRTLEGINLYVYQTDVTGRYSTSGGDNRATRIHGLVRTNAEGRYEFRTIKPGSYPNSRNPAHIHAYVSGAGYPEYWIDEYLFADDPFVTEEIRRKNSGQGSFSALLSLTRGADGVLRGVRDIKIERCTRNCTGH